MYPLITVIVPVKDMAKISTDFAGTEVVFELPDEIEKVGYSKATKARLTGPKLNRFGWKVKYDINQGIERTLNILKK